MTNTRQQVPFDEVFSDVSAGQPKTYARDFLPTGRYPLVDQGKEVIGGYTDDPTKLATAKLPLIVFGDHTRAVKYVDFPFGVGADGVKLFRPRHDADVRYLYWVLRTLDIPASGYSRHSKFLKRMTVPLPSLPEQRRIANILDHAENLRAKRRSALAVLDSLSHAIFINMFGNPTVNPKGYPVARMIELVDPKRPITYGILKPGEDVSDGVPYVRVVDMTDRSIHRAGLRRTTEAISMQYERSLLRQGDLLLSIRGQVGRLAMVGADVAGANITQDTARLAITGADPAYVLECLRTPELQRWMRTFTKGAAVRGINLADVKRIEVPLPPASDQRNFAHAVNAMQRIRESFLLSAEKLECLFASLQYTAFRADL